MEAKDLFCGSFSFYNLTHLDLITMYTKSDLHGIAVLLERSPKLETMFLSRNLKIDEEVSTVTLLSHLSAVSGVFV